MTPTTDAERRAAVDRILDEELPRYADALARLGDAAPNCQCR